LKKTTKKILCFLLLIESHLKSRNFIKKIITGNSVSSVSDNKNQTTSNQGNTINQKENKVNNTKKVNDLDGKVRKLAHACEYFVLSILVMFLIFHSFQVEELNFQMFW